MEPRALSPEPRLCRFDDVNGPILKDPHVTAAIQVDAFGLRQFAIEALQHFIESVTLGQVHFAPFLSSIGDPKRDDPERRSTLIDRGRDTSSVSGKHFPEHGEKTIDVCRKRLWRSKRL